MSNPISQDKIIAVRLRGMADFWKSASIGAYSEWKDLKYVKKTKDRGGHTSKKKFNDYRIGIYTKHKMFEENASICIALAKGLESGLDADFEASKPAGSIQRVGSIVKDNLKLILP